MTEKRFKAIEENIWQGNEIWCVAGGKHCADVIATAMNELINENEQLKQQLLYDGDDVCSICKHGYLTPSIGDYFIRKCKKEHKECSKKDIKYCDDFELKGDVE